jgi:hypothetical protein
MRILSLLSLLLTLTAFASPSIPQHVQESAAFIFEEAFVIPERGVEIARELRAKQVASELTGKALADALTQTIQSIENDGHMSVRFFPEKASTPLASKEEIRERLRQRSMLPPKPSEEPQVSSRMEGNVGILELTSFAPRPGAEEELAAAMARLEGAKAVIVDLRKNGGGAQFLVDLLASYFFPEDDRVLLTARMRGMPQPLVSRVVPTPTRAFQNVPVAVLISERTFSAGEAFAYVLQQFGRAEVIGAKTRGGGRPNRLVDIGGGYVVSVSIGSAEHPKSGTGWQLTGVVPDVAVPADEALSAAKKWLSPQPQRPSPAPSVATKRLSPQPPSPAVRECIDGIIRAFNSTPEEYESQVAQAFAPAALAEETAAQRSEALLRLQQDFGKIEIREVRREGENRVAVGIAGSTGLRGVMVLDHEPAPPHRITNILFRIGAGGPGPGPGPGPAPGPAPRPRDLS